MKFALNASSLVPGNKVYAIDWQRIKSKNCGLELQQEIYDEALATNYLNVLFTRHLAGCRGELFSQ